MVRLHSPRVQCPFHVFFEMITALQNRTLYIKRRMPFLSFPGDKSTCLVIVFDFVPLPQISLLLADSIFTTEIPRKRDLSLTHFERKFWEIHIFFPGERKGQVWQKLRESEAIGTEWRARKRSWFVRSILNLLQRTVLPDGIFVSKNPQDMAGFVTRRIFSWSSIIGYSALSFKLAELLRRECYYRFRLEGFSL